jgi:hypothetical protein
MSLRGVLSTSASCAAVMSESKEPIEEIDPALDRARSNELGWVGVEVTASRVGYARRKALRLNEPIEGSLSWGDRVPFV